MDEHEGGGGKGEGEGEGGTGMEGGGGGVAWEDWVDWKRTSLWRTSCIISKKQNPMAYKHFFPPEKGLKTG